jgi:tetratricopeptide (TPR) repeat protein
VVILWQGPPVYRRITGRTTSWEIAAALLVVAGFVILAVRSRRRTVFQDFPDCTTPDAKGMVPGLGAYLANEVDRLGALYRRVQRERQAEKGADRVDDPIQPAVELDDAAEFLKDAVSPDAKLSVGPVSIPFGSILGLIARLLKGPQITGSLHREGDRLVLLAHYEGKHPRSWRVEGKHGSGATDDKGRWDLHSLVEEMAIRMLGDLALAGSVKFRAVDAFTRAAQASLEDGGLAQPLLLRRLEVRNCLLEAIAEDESFDLAWYNLGVVLLELDDKEMARSVFMRARSGNLRRWEATYALAILPGHPTSRMLLCDQMLSTDPGPAAAARAFDLLGLLCGEQAEKLETDGAARAGKLAVANRRLAVRRAWHALRQAEWSARQDQEAVRLEGARRLASTCLTNMALCYQDAAGIGLVTRKLQQARSVAADLDKQAELVRKNSWQNGQRLPSFGPLLTGGSAAERRRRRNAHRDLRRAEAAMRRVRRPARRVELLLRQAGKLGPLDPRTHQQLGALNVDLRRWRRAASQYSEALRVMIDDPENWVCLACAAARSRRRQLLASQAARALLTLAPLVQPRQLILAAAAIGGFDAPLADQLRLLAAYDGRIGHAIASARDGDARAAQRLLELTQETRSLEGGAWAHYRCAVARCRLEPPARAGPADPVVADLLKATRMLDEQCAPAVRSRNIHHAVAEVLFRRGQVAAALDHAEKATQAAPFSPWAWQLLGNLRLSRAEFGEAEECYLRGLRWVGGRDELLDLTVSLACCRLDRLQDLSAAQPPDEDLADIRHRLEQVLRLLGPAALSKRARVHYWLGRLALALNDSPQAIAQFAAAAQPPGPGGPASPGFLPVLASSLMAAELMKAGRSDQARAAYDRVIEAIGKLAADEAGLRATAQVGPGKSPALGQLLVEALLGKAASLAEQASGQAEARQLIELARGHLPGLSSETRTVCTVRSEALLGRIEAMNGHAT